MKPGPTRGTIAINRIYFVQLSLTHTRPQGLPKWVLGPEGCPLAWRLKSVDTHKDVDSAAGPDCPLCAGSGWCKGEPAETPRPGVPGAGGAGGRAGGWRKSRVGPPSPRGSHSSVT